MTCNYAASHRSRLVSASHLLSIKPVWLSQAEQKNTQLLVQEVVNSLTQSSGEKKKPCTTRPPLFFGAVNSRDILTPLNERYFTAKIAERD